MGTLEKMIEKRNECVKDNKEAKKKNDKEELIQMIEKRIRTTFIGAIASFENSMGKAWGHNQLELTDSQKKIRELWQRVRKEILDKGNEQLKNVRKDLGGYDVDFIGYTYEFYLGDNNEERI